MRGKPSKIVLDTNVVISAAISSDGNPDRVMILYFDQGNHVSVVGRSLVVNRASNNSAVRGSDLYSNDARLAGVAPEALDAFDNRKTPTNLEEIAKAVNLGKAFIRKDGLLYVPVQRKSGAGLII